MLTTINFFIGSLMFTQSLLCMQIVNNSQANYVLDIKKVRNQDDAFKIKFSKEMLVQENFQKGSLIVDFAKQMITDEQNLFAPFQITEESHHATFADQKYPDCFLWSMPNFGLFKLDRKGSVFFGHTADEAPLMHDKLTFDSSGKLFLETLKTAVLDIKSENAQLCGTVITDRLHANNTVLNSGGFKTKHLLGKGNFLNQGIVEFDGTSQMYAYLGIKTFQNKKNKQSPINATITSPYLFISNTNQSFENKTATLCDVDHLIIDEEAQNTKSTFSNKGFFKTNDIHVKRDIINHGSMKLNGKTRLADVTLTNNGDILFKQGDFISGNTKIQNNGNCVMEGMKSIAPVFDIENLLDTEKNDDTIFCNIENNDTLELKNCSLNFNNLTNKKNLILKSGSYKAHTFANHTLKLLDTDWTITDSPKISFPNMLKFVTSPDSNNLGDIICQYNLRYYLKTMPRSLTALHDIYFLKEHKRMLIDLADVESPRKVVAFCDSISLKDDIEVCNIEHLELYVDGPITIDGSLKAPTLTLHVDGSLAGGKDNDHLGTIAATHGQLSVDAHDIDGRYLKFFGRGKTSIESTQGDIVIGAEAHGVDEDIKEQFKQQYLNMCGPEIQMPFVANRVNSFLAHFNYTVDIPNGAYVASNDHLTLKSAKNIFVRFGALLSVLGNNVVAQNEIENLSSKISSHGPIGIQSNTYTHGRKGSVGRSHGNQTYGYPGSGPAQLESLDTIDFKVNSVKNVAGSMRSGTGIFLNGEALERGASYIEEPQTFYHTYFNGHGWGTDWGWKNRVIFNQSCVTQSADEIQMNLGNCVITGNMNSGKIKMKADTALFANNRHTRQTVNSNESNIANVTEFMYSQTAQPGIYRRTADNDIVTEFPLGLPSQPQEEDLVLLENKNYTIPINWQSLRNPLSSINLDLHLQQLLSKLAGKVYAGNAQGNNLATVLWGNANAWRKKHGKDVMSQTDLQSITQSMLISQILHHDTTPQQHLLLYIAPNDINAYQDQGDLVGDTVELHTVGTQTHLNNRIIANGPEGVTISSDTGDTNFETQSYTISSETRERKVVQHIAMPQQQVIAQAGPINITAHNNVNRTGTVMGAVGNINEHAKTGSINKKPLILQTMVETREESGGWFSSTEKVQTNLMHSVVPSTTISGITLYDKAAVSIQAIASQDQAKEKIIYQSPNTVIEGIILANRTTTQINKSSAFSEQSEYESKETPYAMPARIQAPVITLIGKRAKINANIYGNELYDETEEGAQFVAKVAEMLCSGQSLIDSPFMSIDAGYNAGYETMIPPMLMVEKIIRAQENGYMTFESAIIDKDRTEIIGKYVETIYQLKQWQTSWCHKSQLIPDEALVVVAIAIVIVTQGAGIEFLAPMLQSITAATGMQLSATGIAMVNAGVSAIASSAGTSFLRTGDPLQTVQQLVSPTQLKSIAFSMASAGLCAELGSMLDINMNPGIKSFAEHVSDHALRTTVDTLLNIAINNVPVDKALGEAFKQIPLKAAAAYAANKICMTYTDEFSRKTAHSVLGGLSGFATQHNSDGFISGVVGALTAETVGDILISDAQAVCAAARARLLKAGKPLTAENIQQAITREVQDIADITKVVVGSVAVLAHQNPAIAIATGSNVLDNDSAIRGTLYALAEFQAMVAAASQAFVTFNTYEEMFEPQYQELLESAQADRGRDEEINNPSGRKPFVKDPNSGTWFTACISDDLVLVKGMDKAVYILQQIRWHKHPKCPFVVAGHGSPTSITVDNKDIHPEGLAKYNMDELQTEGSVSLDAFELAQLIRTAPNYKEGQHIHLFSCECGAHKDGIAQKLANLMEVPVSAFTGTLGMNAAFFTSFAFENDTWVPSLKEIKTFHPTDDSGDRGSMNNLYLF